MNSLHPFNSPRSASNEYKWGRFLEFHRIFKEAAHAWNYGSYRAKLIHDDFYSMYNMGSEL